MRRFEDVSECERFFQIPSGQGANSAQHHVKDAAGNPDFKGHPAYCHYFKALESQVRERNQRGKGGILE